jgi:hypothetical protein
VPQHIEFFHAIVDELGLEDAGCRHRQRRHAGSA